MRHKCSTMPGNGWLILHDFRIIPCAEQELSEFYIQFQKLSTRMRRRVRFILIYDSRFTSPYIAKVSASTLSQEKRSRA